MDRYAESAESDQQEAGLKSKAQSVCVYFFNLKDALVAPTQVASLRSYTEFMI